MEFLSVFLLIVGGIVIVKMKNAESGSVARTAGTSTDVNWESSAGRTLVITRESQMLNCATKYKIMVNNGEIGKLGNGESIQVPVREDVSVVISCRGGFSRVGMYLRLKTGERPRINFSTNYGGSINVEVRDAVIVEKSTRLPG